MDNVTFIDITDAISGEIVKHAVINRGNGEYTSMPKSVYDEQQAALSTPIVSSDAD